MLNFQNLQNFRKTCDEQNQFHLQLKRTVAKVKGVRLRICSDKALKQIAFSNEFCSFEKLFFYTFIIIHTKNAIQN